MAIPTLRTEIKRLLIISLWVVFGLGYFGRFPLPGFLSKANLLILAGFVTGAAWGYGSWVLGRRSYASLPLEEFFVLATGTGFGLLSLLMFAAGVFGLWTQTGAVAIVVAGLLLCIRKYVIPAKAGIQKPLQDGGWIPAFAGMTNTIPLFLISVGAVLSLLLAFTPVTYYDSLVYHFALPQAYIQAGHWIGQKELIYSAFPQAMEMIWTLGMLLAKDVLANLLGWVISILGLMAVYTFGRRYFGEKTAAWAIALLIIMPAYLLLSSGGYIDVGLALYSFLSFYVLCLWSEGNGGLGLAGFFAGCAVGTKYTGAIPLAIGMVVLLKKTRPLTLKTLAANELCYAGMALVAVSPWLVKNIYYVGNPVFPFFCQWSFRGVNPWLHDAAVGYFRGLAEYSPRSGWHLLQLIWDIAVNGLNLGGGMDVLGDLGWAPLFAFLPALWLIKKKTSPLWLLLLYSLCFFIPWGMSRPVLRFLMPLAPFLALAAAYGYVEGMLSQTRGVRLAAGAFLALLLLSGFHNFFDVADALSLFKVPLGFESREQYLSKKLNYYDAASFVNTLPETSRTYVVGDQRGYYYNRPVLVTPVFNANPLTLWANDATSGEDLGRRLRAQGVTHLLINDTEFKRLDGVYHLFPFTPKGQANWNALRAHAAKSLYHDAHCEVLAL